MPPRKNGSNSSYKKRVVTKKGENSPRAKKVVQYDLNNNFIRIWDCMTDAARACNISHACISDCCRGKQKTAGGFIWRYFDEIEGDDIENISV